MGLTEFARFGIFLIFLFDLIQFVIVKNQGSWFNFDFKIKILIVHNWLKNDYKKSVNLVIIYGNGISSMCNTTMGDYFKMF